jgi:hypothetical protein
MVERIWQNKNPYTLLMGMQISITTMGSIWRVLKKLEIELPYDPVTLLLGIYLKDRKTGYSRDTCTLMFIMA